MSSQFATLEEVVSDSRFPDVDLALRRGRHIDRDDGDWYVFISDAQNFLEPLYRRFGCELVTRSDGFFYLLPTGDQLSRRHLSPGEMLVGQTLALLYLDPATIQSGGRVTPEAVLSRLTGLVGERELAAALEPRRRRFDDERVVHDIIRRGVAQALRRLEAMGFVEVLDTDHVRLRAPLLRFAEPVRALEDVEQALRRLIRSGELVEPGFPSDEELSERAGEDDDQPDEDDGDGEGERDTEMEGAVDL